MADGGELWRRLLTAAAEEARLRGDRRLGTEHLLLGALHDEDSLAVRSLGVSLAAARRAAHALDLAALAAVGVEVDTPGPLAPASFGPWFPAPTSGARAVLKRIHRGTRPRGGITMAHFLLALLGLEPPDPAADLLRALGVDRAAARERVAVAHGEENA